MKREFLTVDEACKLLRISRSTLIRWNEAGDIKLVKIRGRVLMPQSEINRILDQAA